MNTASFAHKRKFSQNFLSDLSILQSIASAIGAAPQDVFLEVGPGQGALTEQIVPRCKAYTALELDERLLPILSEKFQNQSHFTLRHIDALTYDYESHDGQPYRLIGNLPYHISTPLMQRFLNASTSIQDMHLMFQKEVAERICAEPGSRKRGRLSIITQLFCECEYLFTIGAESFDPPPKIDSAVIRLTPRKQPLIDVALKDTYIEVATQAFSAKRKTLYNNLKTLLSREDFMQLSIDANLRAEQLSVTDFIHITQYLHSLQSEPTNLQN